MITKENKKKLLKAKRFNEVNSEFLPAEFYSIKDFNINLQKSNKLKAMPNLDRKAECEFVYNRGPKLENSPNQTINTVVSLNCEKILKYWRNKEFNEIFDMMIFYMKSIFNQKDKNEIKSLFFEEKISFRVYYYTMKIYEIFDTSGGEKYFIKYDNQKTFQNNVEIFYKVYKESYQNSKINHIKNEVRIMLDYFINLLLAIDDVVYADDFNKYREMSKLLI
jgi:hypothetical protein